MALDPMLLDILACPDDKGPLLYFEAEDSLYNPRLRRRYTVTDGGQRIADGSGQSFAVIDDDHHAVAGQGQRRAMIGQHPIVKNQTV